jgi:branched-chain amino acid transport system substrate-binding protein
MPRSTLFPSMGIEILNGMKEYLKQQQVFDQVKLFTDNIGFGINEPEIYGKAEKMLLQEDADIVMVCADTIITEMLQPLFTASNKILLALHFGANFPDNWQPAPTTITHSLNFCLHARLTGKLAANETNKQAANVLSYMDGGYRQCFSMLNAHQSNGGVPRFNFITNHKADEFTLAPLAEFLEQHTDVNTLLCLFAGDMAEKFYSEVSPLQEKNNLNLYVAPMMLEGSLKNSLSDDFSINNVKGFIPWHSSLSNAANSRFKETISSTGSVPNYFSLLGWEAGMMLKEIIRQNNSGNSNAATVVKSLPETSFDSPRGWMKMDGAVQHTYGPSYLAVCKNNMEITISNEAENMEEEWASFTKEKLGQGEHSNWRNTYLCI